MSLRFIYGNSGAGKSYNLFTEVVGRSMEHPGQKFLVIVPEQFTMQTQKELVRLHPSGGILDIDVLSFQRLAYRVFDETGTQTGTVLEETGKNLVLRKLAQEHADGLKVLGGGLGKPGYINEIKSIISELAQYAVTEDDLQELCGKNKERPALYHKLSDILVLYRAFHEYLGEGYVTADELLEVLCRVADRSRLIRESVIVFDGFTGFTPIQNKLMQKLIKYSREVVVSLTLDVREDPLRLEGDHELFAMTKKTVATLTRLAGQEGVRVDKPLFIGHGALSRFAEGSALLHLEQNLFRKRQQPFEGEAAPWITLSMLKDPQEEVSWAAAQVQQMVRTGGFRYRDFAIITGDMEAYSKVLERILPAYGIPCFIDDKKSVLRNPFVEYVRALLEVAAQDFSYESVFRYLRNALSSMKPEEVDVLENYVLALGIRGAARWSRPFERLYGSLDGEGLAIVDALRQRVADELGSFVKLQRSKTATVRERTESLYRLIEGNKIQSRLSVLEEEFEAAGEPVAAKEYHQIYGIVMDLFDKLVEFLGDEEISLKEYAEVLDAGFSDAKVGVIPPGVDQMVAGDMERTRLSDVKVLFFLGVNEGNVPKGDADTGLLSDIDREAIKKSGVELAPTARERGYTQRFYLYLALTKPSLRLKLSCTLLDGDGKALRPSYLMDTMMRLFPGLELTREDCAETPFNEKEAFTRLAEGLSACRGGGMDACGAPTAELYRHFASSEEYGEKVCGLLDAAFDVHEDSLLGNEAARALYGDVLVNSVTRLEKFESCAYAHFLTYGLKLGEREMYEFAPVDIGNIFHDVLETFSKKLEEGGYTWRTVPEDVAEEWALDVLKTTCADYGNSVLGSTARDAYNVERMSRMLIRTVKTLKVQITSGGFEPKWFEERFTMPVELNNNIEGSGTGVSAGMRLIGRIDRIDVLEEEGRVYLKIVDYKTGSKDFSLLELVHGLQLQLPVYMNAALAMARRACPGKEVEPAAVLYYRIKDPLLDADGTMGADEADRAALEELRADGLVLADPDIIKKLDTHAGRGRSQVIPVSFNKDGSLSAVSKAADAEHFHAMECYVDGKVKEIGARILEGHMEASPYELKGELPCSYCGFRGVCALDGKRGGFKVRRLPIFPDKDIWAAMLEAERKN